MITTAIRRAWLLPLLLLCAAAQGQDAPKSLLFNPSETAAVARALADFERMNVTGQTVEETPASHVPNVYVSAIVDFGEGRWTVWANGYRISPNHQTPLFTIVSVSGDAAEIELSGEKHERIQLRPYQTWLSRSNNIVEGIFP